MVFLMDVGLLLRQWEQSGLPGLTAATMLAWQQMCSVLAAIPKYLLSLGVLCVILCVLILC